MDWGWDQAPDRAAKGYPDNTDLGGQELPEVRLLLEQGWSMDWPGGWDFLPCVWPPGQRTWVPDRSTHYAWEQCTDASGVAGERRRVRWTPALLAKEEREVNVLLADMGVPTPRPMGRIWLVRAFAAFATLGEMLDHLIRTVEARGVASRLTPEFVSAVADELSGLETD